MHLLIDQLDLIEVLGTRGLQSLLKSHLNVEKVPLEHQDELDELAFLSCVVVGVVGTILSIAFLLDVTEDVLLSFLVRLNLRD